MVRRKWRVLALRSYVREALRYTSRVQVATNFPFVPSLPTHHTRNYLESVVANVIGMYQQSRKHSLTLEKTWSLGVVFIYSRKLQAIGLLAVSQNAVNQAYGLESLASSELVFSRCELLFLEGPATNSAPQMLSPERTRVSLALFVRYNPGACKRSTKPQVVATGC